ncbi:spore coat protein U domain-containing protein [Sphingomonas sp. BIUV-7]|uniref:Spore coat protein U domain-containing protein n=1 Tax=Sphingomonas natans TaxID=3063330 RepID=A0ABT8YDF2_9SPHN|nr:spore coat protein U domain-containing protein [Sphingomonas sp. BIUV-7]MDO6415813.1 spore coat protein U domain-containing protein [Sphingomonas sp. BIUV-7]
MAPHGNRMRLYGLGLSSPRSALRAFALGLVAAMAIVAGPARACDVATPIATNVGTFSPAAIKASAPFAKTGAGFSCSSFSVLTVLSGNFLKATVATGTQLKLTSAASDIVTYKLFADSAATIEMKPGVDAYYMNGVLLNLLNLLGDGSINVPVYFKLASAAAVPPGIYTGSFSVTWTWNFCNGIAVAGLCVGTTDSGTKAGVVNVTLTVEPKPPVIGLALGQPTWDGVNGTNKPKAIPGSKRRLILTVTNPDIVATEADAVQMLLPTPAGMVIALDGDGTGMGAVVQPSEGSPASGLMLTYASPSSTSDQIDFSSDNGSSWNSYPVAGNPSSQASVTTVRARPLGSMAALSSYTVTIPYSVK